MSSPESNQSSVTHPSFDRVLDALSDASRRTVLRHLADADRPVARADVATAFAARERTDSDGSVGWTTTERAAVLLHHVHLPKLEEAQLVEQTGTGITLTSTGEHACRSLLDNQYDVSDNRNASEE